jgi:hypothetical protein
MNWHAIAYTIWQYVHSHPVLLCILMQIVVLIRGEAQPWLARECHYSHIEGKVEDLKTTEI